MFVLCALALVASGSARAYQIKLTPKGARVRWAQRGDAVVYSAVADSLMKATARAARRWSEASGLSLVRAGAVHPRAVITVGWSDGVWREGGELLALTTVEYDTASGAIASARTRLNDVDFAWGRAGWDEESVVTHELGHAIGLEHSNVESATMHPGVGKGDTSKRTLEADDLAAANDLYDRTGDDDPSLGCGA